MSTTLDIQAITGIRGGMIVSHGLNSKCSERVAARSILLVRRWSSSV
ncbi:hypothetical protein [Halorhabdus tiamatea]|nr:hypothetical protein [Halorhabdus tiamatea]